LLEIDFKVTLIKQLLNRINNVKKMGLSRTYFIESLKAESDARSIGNNFEGNRIRQERNGILEDAKLQKDDQYILMFPQMFIALISSALNEMLYSLYWIVDNGRSDMARTLFKHFLKETEFIFDPKSPHGSELFLRVLPMIHDLHSRNFRDIALSSGILPKPINDQREGIRGSEKGDFRKDEGDS
jgi:hypothetical protein